MRQLVGTQWQLAWWTTSRSWRITAIAAGVLPHRSVKADVLAADFAHLLFYE